MNWVIPDKPVQAIFFQGMMESQRQCSKYCGQQGMVATTGETVICPTANPLIHSPYIGKELDEIMLHNNTSRTWYNPLRITDELQQWGFAYKGKKYNLQILGTAIGMPSVVSHAVDVFKLNFGQNGDIQEHAQKVALCTEQFPDHPKILWGVSRGAATSFNAHALHQYDNVKMIILEGCFDSVEHTIEKRAPTLLKYFRLHTLFHHFLALVTQYKCDGVSPLASVANFPENVPVVFITSHADCNVHPECTHSLMNELKKRGKNPIHYIALKHATHDVYAIGDGEDQKLYCTFLHTLYKRYNLPYIPAYVESHQ